jgi:hypothetical protein
MGKYSLVPLFAVEVKKKKTDGNNQGFEEKVLGQAYGYTKLLAATGRKVPLVIFTNLEESSLCWLKGHKKATKLARNIELRYKVETQLATPEKMGASTTRPTMLPPKMVSPPIPPPPESTATLGTFSKSQDQKLCQSETFSTHNLVSTLMYSALLCALKDFNTGCVPTKIFDLPVGRRFSKPAIRMTEQKLLMGLPHCYSMRMTTDPLDENDKDAIYVIGEVGHGVTSRAFDVLNAQDKEMVLKMHLKTTDNYGCMLKLDQMAL